MQIKYLLGLVLGFLLNLSHAMEPVTGIWQDTTGTQKRTAYSVEVQNNYVLIYIYTYAEDSATTDPTWYIASGDLTQNADGTATGKFDIYTVSNNQLSTSQGTVISGSMDITFTDRETATIDWTDFPGNSNDSSIIKKYWVVGTGTDAIAKRRAAYGSWQLSMTLDGDPSYSTAFYVSYYNPDASANSDIYADVDDNVLVGYTENTGYKVVTYFYDDGIDYTIISTGSGDFWFRLTGGGVEYGAGYAAYVSEGSTPSINDYTYQAAGVRRSTINRAGDSIYFKKNPLKLKTDRLD